MTALFGPANGARISRQDELGHTTHRASSQHKPIKPFIIFLPLILLYYYSNGCPTGPIKTVSATPSPWWGGHKVLPTNSTTKLTAAPRAMTYSRSHPHKINTHTHTLPPNNTIKIPHTRIRVHGHTSRQNRLGNHIFYKQQHITHQTSLHKSRNPLPHSLAWRKLDYGSIKCSPPPLPHSLLPVNHTTDTCHV
jgi:hypothetical protein